MDDLDHGATLKGFTSGQKVFQRYTLQRTLGRGGMGVVWLARDEVLGREVALKFLPEVVAADPTAIDELKREVRRAIDLAHPHIVKTNDFVTDGRLAAVSMEYAPGGTLAQRRIEQPNRVLSVAQLAPWVEQLLSALEYAHGHAEIVHRDLKPSNLMLDAKDRLKVVDFGIAASISDSVSRVSKQAGSSGTPVYMSPQQMMGERPAVTDDLYAVGATLYELLTGKPPFHSGNILAQAQTKVPPTMAARRAEFGIVADPIPAAWEEAVAACLAKDPTERPASARALGERLQAKEPPVDRKPAPPPAPAAAASPPRSRASGRWPLALAGVGVVGVTALVWWVLARPVPPDSTVAGSVPAIAAPSPAAAPGPAPTSTPVPALVPLPSAAPAIAAPRVAPTTPTAPESGLRLSPRTPSAFGFPWVLRSAAEFLRADGSVAVPLSGARVRVVDMAKLYDADPRTVRRNAEIAEAVRRAESELAALNAQGNALVARYREETEKVQNPVLTADARSLASAEAGRLLEGIQEKQRQARDFHRSTEERIKGDVLAARESILRELVAETIRRPALAAADLVLDRSAPDAEGRMAVVYADPSLDATESGSDAGAPARVEVGLVDVRAVVEGHYKLAEMRAKLAASRASADADARRLEAELAALRANAGADSADAVARKEEELRTFRQNIATSIAARERTHRGLILEEVAALVATEAKARSLMLVIDRGAAGPDGTRLVANAGAAPDLTAAVQARIAADRPGA